MIDILLSTYNSEKFLEQFILSLFAQTYKDWHLLIRDDNSSDKTREIINKLENEYPEKISVINKVSANIGVMKSYEVLLSNSKARYIMFADHDDIWVSNKIELTLNKMIEMENIFTNTPILIHTDLVVVDSELQKIHPSFWIISHINPNLLSNFNYLGVCNGVTGCTIMINKNVKEICVPFPDFKRMHDYWIALCVSKFGKINYIDKQTVLYRQHSNNTIGIKGIKNKYFQNKLQNLSNVINENITQYKLLMQLDYGNVFKYLKFKILYLLKERI